MYHIGFKSFALHVSSKNHADGRVTFTVAVLALRVLAGIGLNFSLVVIILVGLRHPRGLILVVVLGSLVVVPLLESGILVLELISGILIFLELLIVVPIEVSVVSVVLLLLIIVVVSCVLDTVGIS